MSSCRQDIAGHGGGSHTDGVDDIDLALEESRVVRKRLRRVIADLARVRDRLRQTMETVNASPRRERWSVVSGVVWIELGSPRSGRVLPESRDHRLVHINE
jgi:hypothetical protein